MIARSTTCKMINLVITVMEVEFLGVVTECADQKNTVDFAYNQSVNFIGWVKYVYV
jgi:hypothetical protein